MLPSNVDCSVGITAASNDNNPEHSILFTKALRFWKLVLSLPSGVTKLSPNHLSPDFKRGV